MAEDVKFENLPATECYLASFASSDAKILGS